MLEPQPQNASHLILIEPQFFLKNEETALNNFFQTEKKVEAAENKALAEFSDFVAQIKAAGVNLITFPNSTRAPDAVFPNNWISTHADGTVCLYPMQAPSRRRERRTDILDSLVDQGFYIRRVVDYSRFEKQNQFMEGTGSLVFDHLGKKAYAALSIRTDRSLVKMIAGDLGYEPVCFEAVDTNDRPIYHTNVLLSIGEKFAVVCLESIKNKKEREQIERYLSANRDLIEITLAQMNQFCANLLQVQNAHTKPVIVLSQRAQTAFTDSQIKMLSSHGYLAFSPLTTIEDLGGGSARCMLAENFLPLERK